MKKSFALTLATSLIISACFDNKTPQPGTSIDSQQSIISQESLNQFADSVDVKYQLVTNIPTEQCDENRGDGNCFVVEMSFTAKQDFYGKGWAIYFSQINPVQSVDSDIFTIEHVNGDLHKITATDKFTGFKAGQKYSMQYRVDFWSLSETDALPNYIVHAPELDAQVIKSTQTVINPETGLEKYPFVENYTSVEKQFNRTATEQTKWATAELLFERNAAKEMATKNIKEQLIPTPKSIKVSSGTIDLSKGISIEFNADKAPLNSALQRLETLGIKQSKNGVNVSLAIEKSNNVLGSYQLVSGDTGIAISANDISGLYYGLQSIAALVAVDDLSIPFVHIDDEPHYQFRGMMVDVARNFHSKQFVLDLLDQMAAYKLNKLHLHLGDDEGWRLEIDGLPELTDISSKRCFDLSEQTCLLPQLGAGVDSSSSVNGYYSKQDYIDILKYASERHIQVIPSLDMPGHSRSSIVAMKARYKRLMAAGDEQGAKQYLLHDENDTTVYSSVQYYNDNTINGCMESSYDFIGKVMDEVKSLHEQAGQPLSRYHIGADETAGAWVESPICKAFIANNDAGVTKPEQVGSYFIERVAKILTERGIETAGWNDGMMHTNPENMPDVVQANSWGLTYWQGHQAAHKLANQNWEIVVSSPDATYFDFPYEADPKEHGYYWASRHSNTEKLFQFMPDNLPVHAEFWLDREDKPYQTDDSLVIGDKGEISSAPMKVGKKFVGIQGQLWSENTRNDDLAEYKIFPRLFALAERAWHLPNWSVPYPYKGKKYSQETSNFTDEKRQQRDQNWAEFANVITNKELNKLDRANIFYRIPTVGGKIIDGKLYINSTLPGLALEYKTAESKWTSWTQPVTVTTDVLVRARSKDLTRAGRELEVKFVAIK
ncbi:family 20 glycosylhydrolase [Thalassotalea crassostreae]|uniref:family 20 glycosylhydrolase n=1 Tax=Thalassotalea crassostreae TaxID=1763536 RepID=UPI0008398E01|nr:family 20 glycosylhydrolase [Thalassotalea crassostreae]